MADSGGMTAETALTLVLLLVGVLIWQVYGLTRRVHRLEQEAGLREKARPLDLR